MTSITDDSSWNQLTGLFYIGDEAFRFVRRSRNCFRSCDA